MASYNLPDPLKENQPGSHGYYIQLLELMKPIMVRLMKVGYILTSMGNYLPRDSLSRIWKRDKNYGDSAAVDCFIEELNEHATEGWFQGLLRALQDNEYDLLADYLKGARDIKDGSIFITLIQFDGILPKILQIEPNDILTLLIQNKVISRRDYEEIEARRRNEGATAAMELLLQRLPSHREDWFDHFIRILLLTQVPDYVDIVKTIEPKLRKVSMDDIPKVTEQMRDFYENPGNTSENHKTSQVVPCDMEDDAAGMSLHYDGEPMSQDVPLDAPAPASSPWSPEHNESRSSPWLPTTARSLPVSERRSPVGQEQAEDCSTVESADDVGRSSFQSSFPESLRSPTEHEISVDDSALSEEVPSLSLDHRQTHVKSVDATNPTLIPNRRNNFNNLSSSMADKPEVVKEIGAFNIQGNGPESMVSNLEPALSVQNIGQLTDQGQGQLSMQGQGQLSPQSAAASPTPEVVRETLTLRDYQEELAAPAISGRNVIIMAPTGSGKTHVALAISKSHLERDEEGMVVFLVPTVDLVSQQWNLYKKNLHQFESFGMSGDIQDSQRVPLGELVKKYQIIVMTPQLMLDSLSNGTLDSIGAFTLMIFDECHHATKSHPYNQIMRFYIDEKMAQHRTFILPQVVGLTASVGVGKSRDMNKAMEHIMSLCGNLDCDNVVTVETSKLGLSQNVNKPTEEKIVTNSRENDPFKKIINGIMGQTEHLMRRHLDLEQGPEAGDLKHLVDSTPAERGCDPYTQWISRLEKPVAKIYDQKLRRPLTACLKHLKKYNESLRINADCRTKDALDFLDKEMKDIEARYKDETDHKLEKLYTDQRPDLLRASHDRCCENPKLVLLKGRLLTQDKKNPDMRVIIFCKTRALTLALESWMNEDSTLSKLCPSRVVGTTASDRGGITQNKREDVLKYFRDGRHKVIVATSVAEEGLDVQKCDLVIRYEYATNEIAMIQARGRGRADDAAYVLVGESGRGLVEKEELNKIRESLMNAAVKRVQELDGVDRHRRIENLQRQGQDEWAMEEAGRISKEQMRQRANLTDWTLRCSKCDQFCCLASDIRKAEKAHHVIIDVSFWDQVITEPHPKPTAFDHLVKTHKLYCAKCKADWGITGIYKSTNFPILKPDYLVIINAENENRREVVKKWRDMPFAILGLSPDELATYSRSMLDRQVTQDS